VNFFRKLGLLLFIALIINLFCHEARAEKKQVNVFINSVDESKIKIKSIMFDLIGETYEIDLTCHTSADGGYSLFNPPLGMTITIYDRKGLKKGNNRVTFNIEKSKYASLAKNNKLTIKFWTEDKEAGHLLFNLTALDIPVYNENSTNPFQMDLRGRDLSSLDLSGRFNDLINSDYNSFTRWPEKLPEKFNPKTIMELGKTPGLKIKELHKKGITGKGISIAIIDQKLLKEHIEYKNRIKHYEEIHCLDKDVQMHGPAVVSFAAGSAIGVAPEADIYYIASTFGTYIINRTGNCGLEYDFQPLAQSINKIIEINKSLPQNNKIRVISVAIGWESSQKGHAEATQAVKKANDAGIFVVSSSLKKTNGFEFNGLGRDPLSDPDLPSSYTAGKFWKKNLYENPNYFTEDTLLVPMDSRTYAYYENPESYSFSNEGGWSWSIPYIAGMYALCCQVKPDITPEIFWKNALETGDIASIKIKGKDVSFGKILNPVKLIDKITRR